MEKTSPRYRRGDTSPLRPGLVFLRYDGKREQWVTPEHLAEFRGRFAKRYHSDPNFKADHIAKAVAHHKANPDQAHAAMARWVAKPGNLEKKQAAYRRWHSKNREKRRAITRRYLATPDGAIINRVRSRIAVALKQGHTKSASTLELIGCKTIAEFRAHLEKQFEPGMSWENMGAWEIDHRAPLAAFNLSDPEQQKVAFNLHNCRPMWKPANRKKSDKIEGELFSARQLKKANIIPFLAA